MTLSFNPSNSPDSLSLVPGITVDTAPKNGGFPGVGSFMELLNALTMIEPRTADGASKHEKSEFSTKDGELPTGKELPDDLPVLPDSSAEDGAVEEPGPVVESKTANVILFPITTTIVLPDTPVTSQGVTTSPLKTTDAAIPQLAPAAASPIVSHLVLSDRSANAAANPLPIAPAKPGADTKQGSAEGGDNEPKTASKGEGIQVRIAPAKGPSSPLSGGPEFASLIPAGPAKPEGALRADPQVGGQPNNKGDGVAARIKPTPEQSNGKVAVNLPLPSTEARVDAPKPSLNANAVSSNSNASARIQPAAFTVSTRPEANSGAQVEAMPAATKLASPVPAQTTSATVAIPSRSGASAQPVTRSPDLSAISTTPTSQPGNTAGPASATIQSAATTMMPGRADAPDVPAAHSAKLPAAPSIIDTKPAAQAIVAEQPKPAPRAEALAAQERAVVARPQLTAKETPASRTPPVASSDAKQSKQSAITPRAAEASPAAPSASAEPRQSAEAKIVPNTAEANRTKRGPAVEPKTGEKTKLADQATPAPRAVVSADTVKPIVPTLASPLEAISTGVRPIAAAAPAATIDTFADVERVVEQIMSARQVDLSKPAAVAVAHREFGALTLTFDQQASGKMNVEIAAEDGEVQRALAAAIAQDRGTTRSGELAAQLGQSSSQPAPATSDRGGSLNSGGSAPGQSSSEDNRSQNSAQREPNRDRAANLHQAPAQNPPDDALYA